MGKYIEVWCSYLAAETANVRPAQVIGDNQQEVRLFVLSAVVLCPHYALVDNRHLEARVRGLLGHDGFRVQSGVYVAGSLQDGDFRKSRVRISLHGLGHHHADHVGRDGCSLLGIGVVDDAEERDSAHRDDSRQY